MGRILIIGANGFTGRRLLSSLSANEAWEVYGCSLRADIQPSPGYGFYQLDITDHPSVESLFERLSPDVVINTSALSAPDYCEQHPAEAYATNVSAVEQLAACCRKAGSRLLHFSTDFVFDGKARTLYHETDQPDPVNYYGKTKHWSEQAVERICLDYAIIRVVVVYGKALPGQHGNIVQLVKSRLENHQEIRVVSDQWRTPTWVNDVVRGVELLLPSSHCGVYHISGGECLSVADMAYRVASFFHLDASLIHPVTTEEMREATPRPSFSGLCIEKARRELGYQPSSFERGLEEFIG